MAEDDLEDGIEHYPTRTLYMLRVAMSAGGKSSTIQQTLEGAVCLQWRQVIPLDVAFEFRDGVLKTTLNPITSD